jgi:hypothetical protein
MFNEFSRYERMFADRRRDGYGGVKPETYRYIDWLTDPDNGQLPRDSML